MKDIIASMGIALLVTLLFALLLIASIGHILKFADSKSENKPSIFKEADALENPNRFRIESGGTSIGVALVTDRETGVQYLYNVRSGEMVMLVDKDGKPFISNGWRDYDE